MNLTAHLTVRDAAALIEFYQRAFGAEPAHISKDPSGRIMHSTLRVGDSTFNVNDEYPDMGAKSPLAIGGTAVTLTLNYTAETIDDAWKRAVDAGAKVTMPIANQFWGGRYGLVEDPSGHRWAFHAHVENVSPEEATRRAGDIMK
jgi:PhnB protein